MKFDIVDLTGDRLTEIARAIRDLSIWVDESPENAQRDPEALLWGRVSKVGEELGEAIQALIGATGQNPRKGRYSSMDEVGKELLDIAVTALSAREHLHGNNGDCMNALYDHAMYLDRRARESGVR